MVRSHSQLLTRVNEASKLVLDSGSVGVESRVLAELSLENGVCLKQSVLEDVMSDAEHNTISDCNLITCNEASVVFSQLSFTMDQEGAPLVLNQFLELLVSRSSASH